MKLLQVSRLILYVHLLGWDSNTRFFVLVDFKKIVLAAATLAAASKLIRKAISRFKKFNDTHDCTYAGNEVCATSKKRSQFFSGQFYERVVFGLCNCP